VGLEGAAFKNPTTLTTLVSIPLAVRNVKIPVIAAGGIGDARGFLAALALGAEAVLLGTLFMAAKECPLSDRRKRVLVEADPYDPELRDLLLTAPKPEDMEKAIGKMKEAGGSEAILRALAEVEKVAMRAPSLGFPYPASSAVGFIDKVVTARELIDGIIKGAEEILTTGGIGGWRLVPKPSA